MKTSEKRRCAPQAVGLHALPGRVQVVVKSGRDPRMPEERLNRIHAGPAIKHRCCQAVPQQVRPDTAGDSKPLSENAHELADILGLELVPIPRGDKQPVFRGGVAPSQVFSQQLHGGRRQGDQPAFGSLPDLDAQELLPDVDVSDPKVDQFIVADSSCRHHGQHRLVSNVFRAGDHDGNPGLRERGDVGLLGTLGTAKLKRVAQKLRVPFESPHGIRDCSIGGSVAAHVGNALFQRFVGGACADPVERPANVADVKIHGGRRQSAVVVKVVCKAVQNGLTFFVIRCRIIGSHVCSLHWSGLVRAGEAFAALRPFTQQHSTLEPIAHGKTVLGLEYQP